MKKGDISLVEHWIVEAYHIDPALLDSLQQMKIITTSITEALGLTVKTSQGFHFGPGVTMVAILAESHMSYHTWPEFGYVYADIATCSKSLTRDDIGAAFAGAFKTEHFTLRRAT